MCGESPVTSKMMTAVRAGTLVDGTGKSPVKDAVILIEGSKIAAAGSERDVKVPQGATLVDGSDKTVMPGLMDMHLHLGTVTDDPTEPNIVEATGKASVSLRTIYACREAEAYINAGFTTIRDPGGWNIAIGLRNAIAHGLVNGPRVFAAKVVMHATTPAESGITRGGGVLAREGADGPWQVRAMVRDHILHDQVDFIKTLGSGSVSSAVEHFRVRRYTLEELTAMADEAHAYGKFVAVHAYSAPTVRVAVEAGVDTIEHGPFISDDMELVKMMVNKGTIWVPTIIVYSDRGLTDPKKTWIPPFRRGKAQEVWNNIEKNFRILHKAGVRIAMGTDTARHFIDHGDNAWELEWMVKFGMTPMEAIVASTKMGGEALGKPWNEQLGTLEKGKLADLIVLDGDPLKDISVLQKKDKIKKVMKDGKVVVDREA